MNGIGLFSSDELADMAASAEEAQREFDEFQAWLRSPEGKAWTDQQIQEATAIAEEFKSEVQGGKYVLSPEEIEQMLAEGQLVKCHTVKRGRANDQP